MGEEVVAADKSNLRRGKSMSLLQLYESRNRGGLSEIGLDITPKWRDI
jgi:hypothetical protein